VNYSDTTNLNVFSHHTRIGPEGGSSEPNEPLDPPLCRGVHSMLSMTQDAPWVK